MAKLTSTPNVKSETYYASGRRETESVPTKWWAVPPERAYESVYEVVQRIRSFQTYRTQNYIRFARLYCNLETQEIRQAGYARSLAGGFNGRVTYNVVKSCIDTAASQIAKSKPRPYFLADDGPFELKQKAKKMTQYFTGFFEECGTGSGEDRSFWGIQRQSFVDGAIFGTGPVKFVKDETEGKVTAERCFPGEIIIDDAEGLYRTPRQMHQAKVINRDVLAGMFPEHRERIYELDSGLTYDQYSTSGADMVEVVESWHLPSSKGAKDGAHVWSIRNATLYHERYEKDYFPFIFHRWCLQPRGFWGRGLADELIGIQLEINHLLRRIAISQNLMSSPQVWLEYQSKVVQGQINNQVGGIKYYAGTPPIFLVPQAMGQEVYQHLENLWKKAFDITGVSMFGATAQKPAGINAAVALRELKDTQSERFALVENMYSDTYIEATYIMHDMLKDLAAIGKDPVVRTKEGDYTGKVLRFRDIMLPDDKMAIRAYPTSLLPAEPAGKLQTVQELVQAGFFEQEEALSLLDFPDVSKAVKIKLAPRDAVIKAIEHNIDKAGEDYIAPEPYMDLEFARKMAQSYYLRGKADGMPEDSLEALRRFQEQVKKMLVPPAPPQPVGPAPMAQPGLDPLAVGAPMDPLATPAPLPQSELMPQGGVA